jgi:hypothetical protein
MSNIAGLGQSSFRLHAPTLKLNTGPMAKIEFKHGTVRCVPSLHRVSNTAYSLEQVNMLNGANLFHGRVSNDCGKEHVANCGEGMSMVNGKCVKNDAPVATDPSQPAGPSPSAPATSEAVMTNDNYPWAKCEEDNAAKHGKEAAKHVCGAIKNKYGNTTKEVCHDCIDKDIRNAFNAVSNGASVDDVVANINYASVVKQARVSNAGSSEGAVKGWQTRRGSVGHMKDADDHASAAKDYAVRGIGAKATASARRASASAEQAEKLAADSRDTERAAHAHKMAASAHRNAGAGGNDPTNEHAVKAAEHQKKYEELTRKFNGAKSKEFPMGRSQITGIGTGRINPKWSKDWDRGIANNSVYTRADDYISNNKHMPPELRAELDKAIKNDFNK